VAVKSTSAHQPPDLLSLCLAITEHAPLPMATVEGASHIVRYVNPVFCRLLDKPSEQLVGIPFCEMLPERDECVTLLDRVFRTGKPESHTEQEHSKPHPVFWSFTMWPVLADERPVGVMIQVTETAQFHEKTLAMNEALMLGLLRQHELTEVADSLNVQLQSEISERKQAEERQHFLLNELAHRGNNLLALIESIAFRSLSGTRSLTEAREVLTQRIQALARSQLVLVTEGFVGAPVAEIIRLEFEAFSDRVEAVGPDVMLNPRVAQTFALLVHELATNATKYGALSRPDGKVAIHWSIEGAGAEARFKFQWQERDGPPVAPRTYQGFGRIVLEKAVEQDFGEEPTIRFEPEGLSYEIDARLSVVAVDSATVGRGDERGEGALRRRSDDAEARSHRGR
jgi:two-component sensor histidine kinase